ncbi:MAG: HEPN domain-containing protein [Candidatus Hydrogenedentes bacterium]|nr:HEPN domain-containing protein [Candidatus Hydrogenedentota bacterium]
MNADIAVQIDKAKESLAAADLLLSQGYYAFATSRAYYAMFYVAQALLVSRGQSYSSHAAVQAAYGREFAKSGDLDARFHRCLLDAQDLRNVSDYGVSTSVTPEQAKQVIVWAGQFLEDAVSYLNRV